MGVETVLLLASAAVSAGSSVKQAQDSKKAAKESKKLAREREAELTNEAITRRQAADKAATAGTRAGRGALLSGTITGMGSPTAPPIATRGTLFGN